MHGRKAGCIAESAYGADGADIGAAHPTTPLSEAGRRTVRFPGARCTVVILADLGDYVMDFMWRGWITYAVGLDLAGAVGRAPLSSWYKRYRVLKSSSPFAGLLAPCCPREVLEYS